MSVALSPELLRQIMPSIGSRANLYLRPLSRAMLEFEIANPCRAAAFLAQIAHESGELQWWVEIWGPSAAQRGYEGRADLGNTYPGDGYRFRGRGPIQVTGRANYAKYGERLGVNLVTQPELASMPDVGFRIAGAYWLDHGLNELADTGRPVDFVEITRRINGGYNGLQEREDYWHKAKEAFGI